MKTSEPNSGKPELEQLDMALFAILGLCLILAAVVVGGIQQSASQAASSSTSYVAR
jgi:hypothetical protein